MSSLATSASLPVLHLQTVPHLSWIAAGRSYRPMSVSQQMELSPHRMDACSELVVPAPDATGSQNTRVPLMLPPRIGLRCATTCARQFSLTRTCLIHRSRPSRTWTAGLPNNRMLTSETGRSPVHGHGQSCQPDASHLIDCCPFKPHPQLTPPTAARMPPPHRCSLGALGPTPPNGSLTVQAPTVDGTLEPLAPHRAITSTSARDSRPGMSRRPGQPT